MLCIGVVFYYNCNICDALYLDQ